MSSWTCRTGGSWRSRSRGPTDGLPVLWHHGTPGCARQGSHLRKATGERGLRLVTYSRAGAGRSTRHPGRTVADVGDGHARRCSTTSMPNAASPEAAPAVVRTPWPTGALVPERVVAVMCVCGVRPYGDGDGFLDGMGQDNLDEFALALEGEDALRPYLEKQQQALAARRRRRGHRRDAQPPAASRPRAC